MKIKRKNITNATLFEDVPAGTVFKDEEETVYMKLDFCYKNPSAVLYNAVDLENGSLVYFNDPNEEVEVLENAVLTY